MAWCAHIATLIDVTYTPQERPTKQPSSRGVKIGAGIIVAVAILGCGGAIAAFTSKSGSGSSDTAPADRSFEAKSICETFVKKQLKAPATAKFSEESAAKVSDVEYTAGGSVDSQNSFGALLRSTFACDLTYNATTQEWTSKSVSVVPA